MKHITFIFAAVLFYFQTPKAQVSFTVPSTVCANETITLTLNTGTTSLQFALWYSSPVGVAFSALTGTVTEASFFAANIYTIGVNITDNLGNASYVTQTMTVLPRPMLILSQTDYSSCIVSNWPLSSKPVSLSVTGGNSYTWSIPPTQGNVNGTQNVVTPTISTCYSVSSQNALGCTGMAMACVSVLPRPAIQVTPVYTVLCQLPIDAPDPDIRLTMSNPSSPNGAYTYTWSGFGIVVSRFQSQIRVTNATSSYTAQLSDANGCVSLPAVANVSIDPCTRLNGNITVAASLSVYPNPTNDYLIVRGDAFTRQTEKEIILSITDLSGRETKRVTVNADESRIDLKELSNGVYILTVSRNKELLYMTKVLKKE